MEVQRSEQKASNTPVSLVSSATLVKPKLRVLLDARKLGDGGIGVYINNLIVGLVNSGEVDLTLIISDHCKKFVPKTNNFKVVEDNAKKYSFDEMFRLAKRIDLSRYDLFHSPHYTLPFNIDIPTVVTIHDLIHITHPEHFFYPRIAKFLIKSAVKRATSVITVSQASKKELQNLAIDQLRPINVIPNSLDLRMMKVAEINQQILLQHGLCAGNYILGVFSNLKPHKRLSDLITSFQRIRLAHPELKLALVGSGVPNAEYLADVFKEVSDFTNVIFIGSVSHEVLAQLYAATLFLAVPSLVEGFCLPVLEAKAQGVPIVTRPIPAVRELLETSDIVADDYSIESFTDALAIGVERFWGKSHIHSQFLSKIASQYSLETTSKSTISVYRDAVSSFLRQSKSGISKL